MDGWDNSTKSVVQKIPLLTVRAGPRDGEEWKKRLKEEFQALIAYVKMNKEKDNDWFSLRPANPEGTRWTGKCWYMYNLLKYEFDLQFDIPITYPATSPDLELPELDGKTAKTPLWDCARPLPWDGAVARSRDSLHGGCGDHSTQGQKRRQTVVIVGAFVSGPCLALRIIHSRCLKSPQGALNRHSVALFVGCF
eukprot:TRINITY_DN6974_c0_g1_i3.p1 TRINITY_DN6974_c0_g1~~TRINITY_DN6974_c0_g1_i3.p1  ORF type:complete len:194 (+),score=13.78 TRINITY_DN6974_c0_g1_i3:325-906(+)